MSGSDDGTVRLWSVREEAPVAAIDAKANVCSVQLSPLSAHLLAFGSANYRVYLYDLRHMKVGWGWTPAPASQSVCDSSSWFSWPALMHAGAEVTAGLALQVIYGVVVACASLAG